MQIQVIRRFYESTMVSIYSKDIKQDVHTYLIGFGFYLCAGISLLDEAQGFSNPNEHAMHKNRIVDSFLLSGYLKWNYALGMVTFVYFSFVQYKSQVILAELRKNKHGKLSALLIN